MNAIEVLHLLRALGLSLSDDDGRLIVQPAELLDDDTRWLIRTHKSEIIRELLDESPTWAWLVRFDGGTAKETYHHPPATRAEVLMAYPDAISVERLPDGDTATASRGCGRTTGANS